jgi:hypothetical protein
MFAEYELKYNTYAHEEKKREKVTQYMGIILKTNEVTSLHMNLDYKSNQKDPLTSSIFIYIYYSGKFLIVLKFR